MNITAEQKKMYFTETAIALRREGFKVEPSVGGRLAVWLDDHPLCEVDQIGGITYRGDNIPTPEYVAAKDKTGTVRSIKRMILRTSASHTTQRLLMFWSTLRAKCLMPT